MVVNGLILSITRWLYYHLNAACLRKSDVQVSELDSMYVEVGFLPKRMKESIEAPFDIDGAGEGCVS